MTKTHRCKQHRCLLAYAAASAGGDSNFEFNDTLKDCDELGKLLVAKIKALMTNA